jgi:FAD/FMN-containing dehydrogenase
MSYRKSRQQLEKDENIHWLENTVSGEDYQKHFSVPKGEMTEFVKSIRGKIVFPWSKEYDADRKDFNNLYPVLPKMIVYARCREDIRCCLHFAQKYGLWTVARSGGHSLAGYSVCDGIVLDLSGFKNISIDKSDNTAIMEAGCTFGDIYVKIEEEGLHIPGGGCESVCVSGYMQGGGYGITSRTYGMNCDCVLEVTIMLADGTLVVANQREFADLFWAVRGGTGGNFGVLLSIKYQLYELGEIWGTRLEWSIDREPTDAVQSLITLQDCYLADGAFANLGMEVVLLTDTDHTKKVVFCAVWVGTEEEFDIALQPLLSLPGVRKKLWEKGRYFDVSNQVMSGIPNVPQDVKAYSRSVYIARALTRGEWGSILAFFMTAPNAYTIVDMECYGGKINAVNVASSAFIHRNVKMNFFCDVFFDTESGDQYKNKKWLGSFFTFMERYGNGHSYQNYPNRDQKDFRWAYWGDSYPRLAEIKKKYDPSIFFHYQQSIGTKV